MNVETLHSMIYGAQRSSTETRTSYRRSLVAECLKAVFPGKTSRCQQRGLQPRAAVGDCGFKTHPKLDFTDCVVWQ